MCNEDSIRVATLYSVIYIYKARRATLVTRAPMSEERLAHEKSITIRYIYYPFICYSIM